MGGQIRIYKPASASKKSLFSLFRSMTKDLIDARELTWRLFLRDFKAKYKQSLLGWSWIFLLPLVAVGTFLILSKSGVIKIENLPVPYPIYGLIGISLWQVFAGGLSATTGSIVAAGSFIVKINFPRESLVISAIGQAIVEFLVRIMLLFLVYLIYGLLPSPWIILSPLLILPLILLTLGLGFITSLLNAIARDIQSFVNIAMGFFLFLMPIMYTAPKNGLLHQINKYNPVFFLIAVPRDIIIAGNFSHIEQFLISSTVAIIIFLFGWLVFNKAQMKIAEAA